MQKIDEWSFSPFPLACVDEVGRGCIAGPVYAAAVSPRSKPPRNIFCDSKHISSKRRKLLLPLIEQHFFVGLGIASVEEIDQYNILQASLLAMKRAIAALPLMPAHVLVDGNQKIPGLTIHQTTLIKGDQRSEWIGAASIFAKVSRDEWMERQAEIFPQYGFAQHKGYGTEAHRHLVKVHGPCSLHRTTFSGIREFFCKTFCEDSQGT